MAATTARTFDAGKKYPLIVSDRLLQREHTPYSISSLQVSPDLRLPKDIKSAKLLPNQSSRDGVNLQLSTPSSMFIFEGKQSKSDVHSLTWNSESQSLILDRVDTDVSFTKVRDTKDSDSSREGSPTKTDFIKDLIDEDGEPDPENPYDWRHQLKVARNPSPEHPTSHSTLGVPGQFSNSSSSLGRALNGTLSSYPIARTPMSRTSLSPAPTSAPASREQHKPRRPRKEEIEIEPEEDDDSNVLEIIEDGAIHKRGRQRWRAWDESVTPGQTPRGLESAAISPSPLPGKTKGVRPGSSLGMSARRASPESDGDVDSIRLGTPLHHEAETKKAKESQVDDAPTPAEPVRDDDGMDDLEREMENELLMAAEQQGSEESEESEEE